MTPPMREKIEQMAFMAMMDGIIHTSVPCNCATCKSENKSRNATHPQLPKRTVSENDDFSKPTSKSEATGSCTHMFPESKTNQATKKTTSPMSPSSKSASANTSNPARSDKVNALLKAESVQAVLDVFNLTSTTKDEKDLATKMQNITKDCKLYQETKDKIIELCDDEDVDLDAVFGLLAKFRYERNMLTTAVIKGNSEREKALLCIQRVDHLMYMLQDVAKKKDSKGTDVMHKLGDIIMEIHDLAKTPSTLYDEFVDIKDEHFDLLNDHEEMHQKFVDVNTCHEKLHSNHDRLQTEHTKLQRDFADLKKKASTVGSLKNDISRLEKTCEKHQDEKAELKKEVEKLQAELAKVNALKHENAQLKKKVTTLSTTPTAPEEQPSPAQTQASQAQSIKKKKGKKVTQDALMGKSPGIETAPGSENKDLEVNKAHEEQMTKLKKAHETVCRELGKELEVVKINLKQLEAVVRKAENARDQAIEKLEVEKATSSNWEDIAKGQFTERDRLQIEIERSTDRAYKLQSTVESLEQSLRNAEAEIVQQNEAHKQVREELEQQLQPTTVSITGHQITSLNSDMIRLLRKIKSETHQLVRDLDDSKSYGGDVFALLDMIQVAVHRVVAEVERDIEEILSVKESEPLSTSHVPEAVLPFAYNGGQPRQTPQFSNHSEYSPHESPQVPTTSYLPPYRPMIPPGFSEPPAVPFNPAAESPSTTFSRAVDPPPGFNRIIEPPSATTTRYNTTPSSLPSPMHAPPPLPHPGVIGSGSRSASSKLNTTPSPGTTPAPSVGSAVLGNGAVGVDWNMWAKSTR